MTESRNPDRLIRAWLDLMPSEAPDRVVSAVLQAAETRPQVRALPRLGHWRIRVNRFSLVAAALAAVAVIVGGGLVLSNFKGQSVGNPTVAPTITPTSVVTPAPTGGPIPAQLQGRWMGSHRDFADSGAGVSIFFSSTTYAMQQSNDNPGATVRGVASADGSTLRVSAPVGDGCDRLAEGAYTWTVTPSGRGLEIKLGNDPCPARSRNLVGSYWLMACRDPKTNCLGDLDAGTYQSQYIRPLLVDGAEWAPLFGGVAYTVPGGWANFSDWPGVLGLTSSSDFAKTTSTDTQPLTRLTVAARALPLVVSKPCSVEPVATTPSSLDAAFADLRKIKGLRVGGLQSMSIDGHATAYADLTFDAGTAGACGEEISFLTGGGDSLSIGPGERQRLYLVDVDEAGFVAIWFRAPDATSFNEGVAQAATIAASMQFK